MLCAMQDAIQRKVVEARDRSHFEDLSQVETITESDTVYRIDRISEDAILAWFDANWPADLATRLVMEGLEDDRQVVFPRGARPEYVCIVDPIDGTRGLMYDKRSAWVLSGVAIAREQGATLEDIEVAAMTELPVCKQRRADQLSAVLGCGREGVVAERIDLDTGARESIRPQPSRAKDLHHGYVAFSRFFPAGKELLARFEEQLYARLYGVESIPALAIFEDQYICSGGQLFELCMGRDRMVADLRPLAHEAMGLSGAMDCHPYDVCTLLILRELGAVVTHPRGGPLDMPLDTTSSVAWVGYANRELAEHTSPELKRLLGEFFQVSP